MRGLNNIHLTKSDNTVGNYCNCSIVNVEQCFRHLGRETEQQLIVMHVILRNVRCKFVIK